MTDWDRMYDCQGDTERVPRLLDQVEREDDAEAWCELRHRLVLEDDWVFPASFAALPRLVRLAGTRGRARELAGAIVRRAGCDHGCEDLLAGCAETISALDGLLDRYLRTRPSDYLPAFRALLGARGQYHWAAVLDDFADDFYPVDCPHCGGETTIAIGGYGRCSAVRDWDLGDVDRRELRPASPEELTGTGRWMYATASRDGEQVLAEGVAHLFGRAECPRCDSVFSIAEEYALANLPSSGDYPSV
ncbi:hypothetical protein [Streptomyces sp. NPDC060198]|uniref:hypothetical protein n=1 Tax=Streptomyces sp. NPDC060198 TaxID=3347070 RepID=UPI003655E5BC